MLIGYARVSTIDQNLDLQIQKLKEAGCEKIFTDIVSGAKGERKELTNLKSQLREGDTVVVWKLDRLGRSLKDLISIIKEFDETQVNFRSLTENMDTASSGGKLIFHIFGSIAEFERDLIRERTQAGLSAARARGRLGGRPKKLTPKQIEVIKSMHKDKNIPIKTILDTFGISRSLMYRVVGGC
jgi:DNA invertase Pin-like site-specific DNA recombinase